MDLGKYRTDFLPTHSIAERAMLMTDPLDNRCIVFPCERFLSQPFVCRLGFPCTTSAAKKDHNSLKNLAEYI